MVFVNNSPFRPASGAKFLWIDGGAGDDAIVVDPKVRISAILIGGNGDDTLTGGGGQDLLIAGDATAASGMSAAFLTLNDFLVSKPGKRVARIGGHSSLFSSVAVSDGVTDSPLGDAGNNLFILGAGDPHSSPGKKSELSVI